MMREKQSPQYFVCCVLRLFAFWFGITMTLSSASSASGSDSAAGKGVLSSNNPRRFHSGVYSQAHEEYAGAFFSSKSRFLASTQGIRRAKFPEQLIFNCIKLRNSCDNCENFLTRDYLDFSVEHLSSTTSILNAALSSDQQKRNFFQLLNTRLENHIQTLLLKVNNKNSKNSKRGTTAPASSTSSSTIAVVAFSDSEANANISAEEASLQESLRQIRHNYFKATIYSILIHFPQIVVYVSKLKDKEKVLNWSLPLLEVIDLSATLARVPTTAYYNNRPMEQLLPKYALLDLADKMKSQSKKPSQSQSQSSPLQDPLSPSRQKEWSSYTSIFYTEGDQILHLRKLKYFYQMFDASDGDFLFIPHRLQTLPLYDNFPAPIQKTWKYRKVGKPVNLVTQEGSGGSCCDNGRLNLPGCGNWWYFCEKWGVKNYTTWLKFSEHGYTNALVTEHEGLCSYSSRHIRCPLPAQCDTTTIGAHAPSASSAGTTADNTSATARRKLGVPAGVTGAVKSKLVKQFLKGMEACPENVHRIASGDE